MGERFPGGVISKTPPTVTGPTDGEGGSASGVWSLTEVLDYVKAGTWPKGLLPRELYAWGDNSPNGQLGLGDVVDRSSPVQVGVLTDWSQVAAGGAHTVSIKTDGTLWTWGSGANGQLGDGTTVNKSSPVQVGALTNWSQISATRGNATLGIKIDNTLWAWGNNADGRLGDGTTISRSSPVQVGALTNWAQVSGGNIHAAAVKTDGTLWTWGANNSGQLGDGTVVSKSSPVQIGALTNWAQVSGGGNFIVAVKTGGTLWSWGLGSNGRLGDGTTISKSSPVQVGALTNWEQVFCGTNHTAAVKTDGTLWSWARNNNGQLGDGTTADRSSPVQIGALTNWSQVSAGYVHTASIKSDGTLWAWGDNGPNGQLGDGTVINTSSPIQVGALTNWIQAACGNYHTAGITKG